MSVLQNRKKKPLEPMNLIPILDSVFILVFFLLMTAQFLKLYEIGSDLPIISDTPPPVNIVEPLNLTLRVDRQYISIHTGKDLSLRAFLENNPDGSYRLTELQGHILQIKNENLSENAVVIEPSSLVVYDDLIKIIDHVRDIRGSDGKKTNLFSQIVFGNLSDKQRNSQPTDVDYVAD